MKKQTKYNGVVIERLIEKYGFKRNYILKSIRGERVGEVPIRIKEEYHQLDRASRAAIKKLKKL